MNDWRALLRQAGEGETMPPDRAAQVREAAVGAARRAAVSPAGWHLRLAIAAVMLAVLADVSDHGRVTGPIIDSAGAVSTKPQGERRQLQFSTPGGTRIIWELNPEFTLTETMP